MYNCIIFELENNITKRSLTFGSDYKIEVQIHCCFKIHSAFLQKIETLTYISNR